MVSNTVGSSKKSDIEIIDVHLHKNIDTQLSRGSVVSSVMEYGPDGRISISSGMQVQNGSGTQPASCSLGSKLSSPGGRTEKLTTNPHN